jgi:hypothetical protein
MHVGRKQGTGLHKNTNQYLFLYSESRQIFVSCNSRSKLYYYQFVYHALQRFNTQQLYGPSYKLSIQ